MTDIQPPQVQSGTITVSLSLVLMLITFVTPLIAGATAFVALSGRVASNAAAISAIDRQLAEIKNHTEQQVDRIDRNVAYLCNERRRDNQENGKPASECR